MKVKIADVDVDAAPEPSAQNMDEIIERVIAQELKTVKRIEGFTPIIETYV